MGTSAINDEFIFKASTMKPTKARAGGEARIVDKNNFPVTNIASAIVRLKPGGLRELHWHPLSDEWQYYVSGKGRMTVFKAGGKARTFDFEEGDVGYSEISRHTTSKIRVPKTSCSLKSSPLAHTEIFLPPNGWRIRQPGW